MAANGLAVTPGPEFTLPNWEDQVKMEIEFFLDIYAGRDLRSRNLQPASLGLRFMKIKRNSGSVLPKYKEKIFESLVHS